MSANDSIKKIVALVGKKRRFLIIYFCSLKVQLEFLEYHISTEIVTVFFDDFRIKNTELSLFEGVDAPKIMQKFV